jgi:hypothetical protein
LGLGTINWNLQGEYTRDHHPDVFASTIIEGPDKWKVRPVSEFFYEEEFGVARKLSALVGAIWQVSLTTISLSMWLCGTRL